MKIINVIKDIILAMLVFGGLYLFCVHGLMVYGMSNNDSIELGTIGFILCVIMMIYECSPRKKKNK